MKKLLLTGIAVLFLAAGTAHAAAKLPKQFVGQYCYERHGIFRLRHGTSHKDTGAKEFYIPFSALPGNGSIDSIVDSISSGCYAGWISVGEHGTGGPGLPGCDFDKVKKIASSNLPNVSDAYRVHANCEKHGTFGGKPFDDYYSWHFKIQIIDKHLVITYVSMKKR
jgi:hypothetical protein